MDFYLQIWNSSYKIVDMDSEAEEVYKRLQVMYEIMQQSGDCQDLENAIFEYEDCVTPEDYAAWKEKYAFFL